jgi:hypothetical protein
MLAALAFAMKADALWLRGKREHLTTLTAVDRPSSVNQEGDLRRLSRSQQIDVSMRIALRDRDDIRHQGVDCRAVVFGRLDDSVTPRQQAVAPKLLHPPMAVLVGLETVLAASGSAQVLDLGGSGRHPGPQVHFVDR